MQTGSSIGTKDRIPSLDGARTVSMSLVLVSHLGFLSSLPIIWRFDYGNLGVRVFFVISGFLITSLLIEEHEKTGTIHLLGFYVRRFLRLAPAYWVYIAVIALLIPTGIVQAKWSDLLPTLLYYANYDKPIGALGHCWSLAVEEQFYFLWPVAIVLLGLHKSYRTCAFLILIAPLFRLLAGFGHWPAPQKFAFECVADALATGCVLALARPRLWEIPIYRRIVSSRLAVAVPLGALLLIAVRPPEWVTDVVGLPLLNAGIAITLDRYMRYPDARLGAMLNLRPMVWLGGLSYSIYLWHPLWVETSLPVPIKLLAIIACAIASYNLVEQPFLSLRKRMRQPSASAIDSPA